MFIREKWLLLSLLLVCGCGHSPQGSPPAAANEKPSNSEELSPEVRKRLEQAVVLIDIFGRPRDDPGALPRYFASGSGFIVAREGLILTNRHVVAPVHEYERIPIKGQRGKFLYKPATDETPPAQRVVWVLKSVEVRLQSGTDNTKVYPAQVLATRPYPLDMALLRIFPGEKEKLVSLPLATQQEFNALRATQSVWSVGFPRGWRIEDMLAGQPALSRNSKGPDLSIRSGKISSLRKGEDGEVKTIDHSAGIAKGNSGGPLVDETGKVLGVNYRGGGDPGEDPFHLALPIPFAFKEEAFLHALETRRDSDEGGKRPHQRIIKISADDPDYEKRIRDALCDDDIDTIQLGPGEFRLGNSIEIRGNTWLRGAGAGKTNIVIDELRNGYNAENPFYSAGMFVRSSQRGTEAAEQGWGNHVVDFFEMSDLTFAGMIDSPDRLYSKPDWSRYRAGIREFHLHDANFRLKRHITSKLTKFEDTEGKPSLPLSGVNFTMSIRGDVVNCRFRLPKIDSRAASSTVPFSLIEAGTVERSEFENAPATFAQRIEACRFSHSLVGHARTACVGNVFEYSTLAAGPIVRSNVLRFHHNNGGPMGGGIGYVYTSGMFSLGFDRIADCKIVGNRFICTNPIVITPAAGNTPPPYIKNAAIGGAPAPQTQTVIAGNYFENCRVTAKAKNSYKQRNNLFNQKALRKR